MNSERTGDDVEHSESGESAGGDGEEEREEVHERKHPPGEHNEDQDEPALLRSRNESFLVKDEECHQNKDAGYQEVEQIGDPVGQPVGGEMQPRYELQMFGSRCTFPHCSKLFASFLLQ